MSRRSFRVVSWRPVVVAVLLTALFLASGGLRASPGGVAALLLAPAVGSHPFTMVAEPRSTVPDAPSDAPLSSSSALPEAPAGNLSVLVSFDYANGSRLTTLLAGLGNPSSPLYHHYLNATEFDAEFAPPASVYAAAVAYFESYGIANVTTLPDRLALLVPVTAAQASAAFGTTIRSYEGPEGSYVAPSGPVRLPASLAPWVSEVSGLSSRDSGGHSLAEEISGAGVAHARPLATPAPLAVPGYLSPVTVGTVQYEYLPDFQVAYDERSLLLEYGFPANVTVAAILASGSYGGPPVSTSCGNLTAGQDVGPWDPADLSAYFNEALPSSETIPSFTAVPLGGATAPGCLASWDSSGQVLANTADLDALGSMIPGASIYGVYGATWGSADASLATILSPPSTLPAGVRLGLAGVTVISTGYGASDRNDTAWFQGLQQAQVRGITVVAASGDADDNAASSAWTTTRAEFPSSMAFATFGDVAVGGETVTLSTSNLTLASTTAWNTSAADTAQGGPLGSEGGISTVFTVEPAWQAATEANSVLNGLGRGVPDLAAVANNTLVTITVDGHQEVATNVSGTGPWTAAMGTGIAASVVAGLVAEIDFVLGTLGSPPVGFLDPALYTIANEQFAPLPSGGGQGSIPSTFNSSLPAMGVRDIVHGGNYADLAVRAYDLVTGWGSLDAYNFSMYLASPNSAGVAGRLGAVSDSVDLAGLTASTHYSRTSNTSANFSSFQQSVYLANAFGAPVYGARILVYIHHLPSGWSMNFTGWVTFPFNGLYPNLTVSEYWRPASGELESSLPVKMNLTTTLLPASGSTPAEVRFAFNVSGTSPLTLNVPGAAFIIGATNYSYIWQGDTYSNGPKGSTSPLGYLAPQSGLEGGPPGGVGEFGSGTSGSVAAWVEPVGGTAFLAATTANVTSANTHAPESAANLSYSPNSTGSNHWTFAYTSGGVGEGISEVGPTGTQVTWTESGLPTIYGWHVELSGGVRLNAAPGSPSISAQLVNGVYAWSAGANTANYSTSPDSGNVTVSGTPVHVSVTMILTTNTVTFSLAGPTPPFPWTIVVGGGPTLMGTGATLATTLRFGEYTFTASDGNKSWKPASATGSFLVSAKPTTVQVTYVLVSYTAEVVLLAPKNHAVLCTITISNQSRHEYQLTYVLHLPNGTYNWSVSDLPSGYHASPSSGTFTISGGKQVAAVTVTGPPAFGLFGLGIWGFVLVGAVGAAAVAGVLVWWRRRRTRASSRDPGDDDDLP
jgi:hypothetical protein